MSFSNPRAQTLRLGAAALSETAGPLTKGQTAFPQGGDWDWGGGVGRGGVFEKNISQLTQGGSKEKVNMGPQSRDPLCLVSRLTPPAAAPPPMWMFRSGFGYCWISVLLSKNNKEPKNTTASLQGLKLRRLH